jgi:hypothetical protein
MLKLATFAMNESMEKDAATSLWKKKTFSMINCEQEKKL